MKNLYPLKFNPIFKEKIWGGRKIQSILGKEIPGMNCGETWELSGVEGNISRVSNGQFAGSTLCDLVSEFKGELVGEVIYEQFGSEFPFGEDKPKCVTNIYRKESVY